MQNNKKFIIVGNGEFKNKSLNHSDFDFICACDGGYRHLKRLNIKPDLIIGDFDSLDLIPNEENIIKLNPIKDETDMFSCVKKGLELGYKEFELYGALGKRNAHTIANFQLLKYLKNKNIKCTIIDGNTICFCLKNESLKIFDKDKYISIFSLANSSTVTLKNFKYELNEHRLTNEFPLGIDNEFNETEGEIIVLKGCVLVIIEDKEYN